MHKHIAGPITVAAIATLLAATVSTAAQAQDHTDAAATPISTPDTTPADSRVADSPATDPQAAVPSKFRPMYFGLFAGGSEFKTNLGRFDEASTVDYAGGYRVGWRFRPHLAVEGFVQSFGYINALFGQVFDSPELIPNDHFGAALVGELPFGSRLSAYGRVGVGITSFVSRGEVVKSIIEPSVGLGMALGPIGRMDFKIEAARFTRSDTTTRQLVGELRF